MNRIDFRSYFVCNEMNLNEISKQFGVTKKIKWDEPLILTKEQLKGVIRNSEGKRAYLFHFGSIVCINMVPNEVNDILQYIQKFDSNIKSRVNSNFTEDFTMKIESDKDFELSYNSITIQKQEEYYNTIVATILGKSVALEKIETDIDILLDEIENIMGFLDKGKFKLRDNQLAKTTSKILSFKYNTISYIMLLDKPDIAWKNERVEELFLQMTELFELEDRYEKIKHKTEVLLDITEVFTSLSHAKRGTRLEWMVIILIFIEILLSLADKLI